MVAKLAKAASASRSARISEAAIPAASAKVQTTRPITVSQKRISRLRMNWFVVGAVSGIGLSFFMNALFAQVILPHYRDFMTFSRPQLVQLSTDGKATKTAHLYTSNDGSKTPTKITLKAAESEAKTAPAKPAITLASLSLAPDAFANILPFTHKSSKPKADPQLKTLSLKVHSGDTLLKMLMDQDVSTTEAHKVVNLLRKEIDPRSLKIGQEIALTLRRDTLSENQAAVQELAIHLPNLSRVALARLQDGGFSLETKHAQFKQTPYRAIGTVTTSLYQAAEDAGIPISAMHHIIQAYSYDVDFQRDIHPGDKIEVLLNRKTTDAGEIGGYEKLRYAALTLHGKKQEIFYYKSKNGRAEWYDNKGHSVRKSLLRTPINAARISSGFGMRRHPVLGYSKMHKGVDFAAARGTPIFAAGDGVVTYRGRKGGYGNYIRIRHNGTYSTAYAHASRFNSKVRKGSRVKQGQVIAYVGTTGRSTGPHLHYEVLQKNRQVNPRAQKFNTATALGGKQLKHYKSHLGSLRTELSKLKLHKPDTQLALR
jgi:murein DD-endopeptidase MepM/ murein hydrolase activator NlpD